VSGYLQKFQGMPLLSAFAGIIGELHRWRGSIPGLGVGVSWGYSRNKGSLKLVTVWYSKHAVFSRSGRLSRHPRAAPRQARCGNPLLPNSAISTSIEACRWSQRLWARPSR
jgi:hypothetical protein